MKNYLIIFIEKIAPDINGNLQTSIVQLPVSEESEKIKDIIKDGGIQVNNIWYPYHQIKHIEILQSEN